MLPGYYSRGEAHWFAKKHGVLYYKTFKLPTGRWQYESVAPNAAAEYAHEHFDKPDWLVGIETIGPAKALLVYSCLLEEITEDIPSILTLDPLITDRGKEHVSRSASVQTYTNGAGGHIGLVTGHVAGQIGAVAGVSAQAGDIVPPRRDGAVKRVWAICESNSSLTRKEQIELCVSSGINKSTAGVQQSAWAKFKNKQ